MLEGPVARHCFGERDASETRAEEETTVPSAHTLTAVELSLGYGSRITLFAEAWRGPPACLAAPCLWSLDRDHTPPPRRPRQPHRCRPGSNRRCPAVECGPHHALFKKPA